eukprot:scaffold3772_cov120-Isochrysis_galbana.AAC.4
MVERTCIPSTVPSRGKFSFRKARAFRSRWARGCSNVARALGHNPRGRGGIVRVTGGVGRRSRQSRPGGVSCASAAVQSRSLKRRARPLRAGLSEGCPHTGVRSPPWHREPPTSRPHARRAARPPRRAAMQTIRTGAQRKAHRTPPQRLCSSRRAAHAVTLPRPERRRPVRASHCQIQVLAG